MTTQTGPDQQPSAPTAEEVRRYRRRTTAIQVAVSTAAALVLVAALLFPQT